MKFPAFAFFLFIMITGCAVNSQNILRDAAGFHDEISLHDEIGLQDADPEMHDMENPSESGIIMDTAPEAVKKPMIALTFDDGPYDYTQPILDILERYGVRATFFVLGENVEERQDTVRHAVKNGNEIAGHTWSHLPLTELSNKAIEESIQATSAIIEQVTGIPSCSFFRPPFGLVNQRVANVSAGLGYSLVGWTVDPQDWRLRNVNLIYDSVMNHVKENSIILLHDIFDTTASAMERVIPALIAEGYHLVTVSELLHHVYGELKPGRMYGNPAMVR